MPLGARLMDSRFRFVQADRQQAIYAPQQNLMATSGLNRRKIHKKSLFLAFSRLKLPFEFSSSV
jgi:hypothetical protein